MGLESLRDLIESLLNGLDPHEFATAYVNHVEAKRSAGEPQTPVSIAMQRWAAFRSI